MKNRDKNHNVQYVCARKTPNHNVSRGVFHVWWWWSPPHTQEGASVCVGVCVSYPTVFDSCGLIQRTPLVIQGGNIPVLESRMCVFVRMHWLHLIDHKQWPFCSLIGAGWWQVSSEWQVALEDAPLEVTATRQILFETANLYLMLGVIVIASMGFPNLSRFLLDLKSSARAPLLG